MEKHGRKRRLVAYDGTPSARRALDHAAELHHAGDSMGLIYVAQLGGEPDGHLLEASRAMSAHGIEATPIAAVGNPARTICVAAERDGYDTIVVGRRNVSDTGLLLLGSVSARVVAGAPCHVVVVA